MSIYDLIILGDPRSEQLQEVEACVSDVVSGFGLTLGSEIGWHVSPASYSISQQKATAAVFFGTSNEPDTLVSELLDRSVPVVPVVESLLRVSECLPESLQPFNCLGYSESGGQRVATALLECAGLLPRQRRVFLSYKRSEARGAAVQLFEAFSERLFDVFLDTHGIPPGEDFQELLWHRLCDSDVLVMLDTPEYFESRWTAAEFGRALAKGISVLRIGWPDTTPSIRTQTCSRAELIPEELSQDTGRIADAAVERICRQLEEVRSQSHAVRTVNLASSIRHALESIGGTVSGIGMHKALHAHLPTDETVVIHPTLGVPSATTMHDASTRTPSGTVAVVYDAVGLRPRWITHLDWLGEHISSVKWMKSHEVAWDFADWQGESS